MTIAELITLLKDFNQNAEVRIGINMGDDPNEEHFEIIEVIDRDVAVVLSQGDPVYPE